MCLILFAYRSHPDRPLVVAANRDEFYARPARAAHWWDTGQTAIFGGRDSEALGTWLAVSRDGRLAAVTNWTEDRKAPRSPRSRGDLPWHFLREIGPAREFVDAIEPDRFAGFNFIAYDGVDLVYTSNRTGEVRVLGAGVYGLTNTRLGPAPRGTRERRAPCPRLRAVAQGGVRRGGAGQRRRHGDDRRFDTTPIPAPPAVGDTARSRTRTRAELFAVLHPRVPTTARGQARPSSLASTR